MRRRLMIIGAAFLLMSASGCASLRSTTGIEAPAAGQRPARLSLCETIDRDELTYSRSDTQQTKDQLGGVIEKYDAICSDSSRGN